MDHLDHQLDGQVRHSEKNDPSTMQRWQIVASGALGWT